MIYLGGDKGWVRMDLLPKAVGDPVPAPGQRAERKINNGITAMRDVLLPSSASGISI